MTLIEICENLIINIEHIYALGKENNQSKIDDWTSTYEAYINEFSKNPIELTVDGQLYKPILEENVDKDLLNKYLEQLKYYILDLIGEKPEYYENYYTVLNSGNRVNLTKEVYDILKQYLKDNCTFLEKK